VYAVVGNPGQDDQFVVAEFRTYLEAVDNAEPDQDVMRVTESGDLTTEL